MTCDQYRDQIDLYALGALEESDSRTLAVHLADGCAVCEEALRQALNQAALVSRSVPLVNPPRRLRRRVADAVAVGARAPRQWLAWALAAAALVALAISLTFETRLNRAATGAVIRLPVAEQARQARLLEILGAPGTRRVSFSDVASQEARLHGALYIHQKLGLALVIDRLNTAPAGWKYQSWLIPKTGAPQPVEPFHPDRGGRAVSVVPGPVEVAGLAAVAVSMEPQGARPTKPTTMVFAAKLD